MAPRMLKAFIVVIALAGCTSPSQPPATSTPATSTPSASSSPGASPVASGSTSSSSDAGAATSTGPSAVASTAALDAYRGFWAARVLATAHPTQRLPPELSHYAIDTALANDESAILLYRQQGIEIRGQPLLNPTVTSVELTAPPSVAIRDCVDSAHWVPVFAKTGKSALAPGQQPRTVSESLATVYDNHWVIRRLTVYRDRAC